MLGMIFPNNASRRTLGELLPPLRDITERFSYGVSEFDLLADNTQGKNSFLILTRDQDDSFNVFQGATSPNPRGISNLTFKIFPYNALDLEAQFYNDFARNFLEKARLTDYLRSPRVPPLLEHTVQFNTFSFESLTLAGKYMKKTSINLRMAQSPETAKRVVRSMTDFRRSISLPIHSVPNGEILYPYTRPKQLRGRQENTEESMIATAPLPHCTNLICRKYLDGTLMVISLFHPTLKIWNIEIMV